MSDVTRLLESMGGESPGSAEELLPLVYDELRRLAAAQMDKERPGHTLQPTALVHEAWARLVDSEQQSFANRQHFFRVAAEAMRRILVESARRKRRQKRGSGQPTVPIEDVEPAVAAEEEKVLLVHEALELLSQHDPRKAELVKLRYFVGLNHQEIGILLEISEKTVDRQWAYAKSWLLDLIERQTNF